MKDFYEFRKQNIIYHKPHRFSEEFFKELLDTITGIYVKKYGAEEKKQELHWILIEDLRSFVEFITPFIQQAIAPDNRFREDLARELKDYEARTGYKPTPESLAREMAYVLLNKIVFYKVLERYYNLPKLKPLYEKGEAQTCSMYLSKLKELFNKAVELSRDFEAVFRTGIYDAIDFIESEEVLKVLDWLIRLIDSYEIERLGDIVGFIYEELIPGGEKHKLGQFYTPRPIAELIVKWCVRNPDDKNTGSWL
uniref:site-specific DNA-methyltransferase (adenine-specific) n=1 Tax=Ignisphaera aggregans TaxID=334771 RepID=A0A7J3YT93_9CREN